MDTVKGHKNSEEPFFYEEAGTKKMRKMAQMENLKDHKDGEENDNKAKKTRPQPRRCKTAPKTWV